MTLALDFPVCRGSALGQLDPRFKLASLTLAALAVSLCRSWQASVCALALAMALALWSRLPWRWYCVRVAWIALVLLAFLVWPVFFPAEDDAVWDIGFVQLSIAATMHVAGVLSRAAAVVSLMLVLLATTSWPDLGKAAQGLFVPGLLIQILLLAHRYLFLLGEEFHRLRIALRVRGFRNRATLHAYRTIGQVAGTILVRSEERAERVAQAMRVRGFDGRFRSRHDFSARWRDALFAVLVVAAATGLVVWDWQ